MHTPRFLIFALTASLLASCSEDDPNKSAGGKRPAGKAFQAAPRETASLAADAGKLVPADAIGVLRIKNIGAFVQEAKEIGNAFQPRAGEMLALTPLLMMIGLREKDIDMSGDAVVALSLTPRGPAPTFVLPSKNAKDAADLMEMPAVTSGNYLAMALGSQLKVGDGTPAVGEDLPADDFALRLNLKTLLAGFKPMIDQFLDPRALAMVSPELASDPAAMGVAGFMVDWLKDLVGKAENLDLSVSLDQGALSLDVMLTVAADGAAPPSATDRAIELCRMLPMADAALVAVYDLDWQSMLSAVGGAFEQMGDQGKQFAELKRLATQLYGNLDGGAAVAMDFSPTGIQFMGLMESSDSDAFAKGFAEYMESPAIASAVPGVKVDPVKRSSVEGVSFATNTMHMDMAAAAEQKGRTVSGQDKIEMGEFSERFLGKGGMRVSVAGHEGLVLLTTGDVAAVGADLAKAVKSGKKHTNSLLSAAVRRLHAAPSFFMAVDVRKLLTQMQAIAPPSAAMPAVPAGGPVPIWVSVSAHGSRYGIQAHVDLKGIAELVAAMK